MAAVVLDEIKGRDYQNERELVGLVVRTFTASERFTAGRLAATDGPVWDCECSFSIRGNVPTDTEIVLHGHWEKHKTYGWQFRAESYTYPMPDITATGVEGLISYLANESGFKGIGPAKARLIAEEFGADFDRVIREQSERIAEVGKLTLPQVEAIQRAWIERTAVNAISMWLAEYGLTARQIQRIAEQYGNQAQAVLQDNPYRLMDDLDGFGFARTDQIALKMGVPKDHPGRIRACILHTLDEVAQGEGHTYVELDALVKGAVENLYLDSLGAAKLVRENITSLANDNDSPLVVVPSDGGKSYVALRWLQHEEVSLYTRFREYSTERGLPPTVDVDTTISAYLSTANVELEEAQLEAVRKALNHRISIITGGAGTGKSYTIKTIRNILRNQGREVAVCAPTGKAARRLVNDDIPASTIHRLLEYSPNLGGFTYTKDNKLPVTAVIIDEVSMCAVPLLYSLISAIDLNDCVLILVGDVNQLPPIGPGNVLRDCIEHSIVPITRLTVCHRNAGKLKTNCGAILDGQLVKKNVKSGAPYFEWFVSQELEDPNDVIQAICVLMEEQFTAWEFDPISDCQIITPQRKGPLGCNRLNLELQRVWQRVKYQNELPQVVASDAKSWDKRPTLYVGDKIMQIKNDYKLDPHHGGVMNGTGGVIQAIRPMVDDSSKMCYAIHFEDREACVEVETNSDQSDNLALAYAVTCHKVQGSQYDCVVSIVHRQHAYMLSRNLLYTAATRARLSSILLGEPVGMRRAVRTITSMERNTWMGLLASRKIGMEQTYGTQ